MLTVYGSSTCVPCRNTKRYLDKKNISYDYVDVTTDQEGSDYIDYLGYTSIPVIVTDAGQHWSGFDPDKLELLEA